ncbi:MAG: diguanylate cyclase [Pseudomonadota bacterium]
MPSEQEADRLEALRRYAILDSGAEHAFDRITALAARLLRAPIALASLVDADRVWFKSHYGVAVDQVARIPGFCATAIEGDGLYVVEDAANDPRARDNPLVTGGLQARFYAAVPLRTPDGFRIGALCVVDHKPRTLTADEGAMLETLAGLVVDQMELRLAARRVDALSRDLLDANQRLRNQATHDDLTGLWNRRRILEHLESQLALAKRQSQRIAVVMVDIDHFKAINDIHGHLVGDEVLRAVARRLLAVCRTSEAVGRFGGEEFLAVFYGCSLGRAAIAAERLRRAVCETPLIVEGSQGPIAVSISGGIAVSDDASTVEGLLRAADASLYAAKAGGRNRIEPAAA